MEPLEKKSNLKSKMPIEIVLLICISCIIAIMNLIELESLRAVVASNEPVAAIKAYAIVSLCINIMIPVAILDRKKFIWFICIILAMLKVLSAVFAFAIHYSNYIDYGQMISAVFWFGIVTLLLRKTVSEYFSISSENMLLQLLDKAKNKVRNTPIVLSIIILFEIYLGARFIYNTTLLALYSLEVLPYDKTVFVPATSQIIPNTLQIITFIASIAGILRKKRIGYYLAAVFFMVMGINYFYIIYPLIAMASFYADVLIRYTIEFAAIMFFCWFIIKNKVINAEVKPVTAIAIIFTSSLAIVILGRVSIYLL